MTVTDSEVETIGRLPSDERVRSGTGEPVRPAFSWFGARKPISGSLPEVTFVRRVVAERHVRAIFVWNPGAANGSSECLDPLGAGLSRLKLLVP